MNLLNIIPILLTAVILFVNFLRGSATFVIIGLVCFFVLSSFPLLWTTAAKGQAEGEMSFALSGILKMLGQFFRSWWGFVTCSAILTFVRRLILVDGDYGDSVGLFLLATIVLFALFESISTGWAFTNTGNFKKGQIGYVITVCIEFSLYCILTFTDIVRELL